MKALIQTAEYLKNKLENFKYLKKSGINIDRLVLPQKPFSSEAALQCLSNTFSRKKNHFYTKISFTTPTNVMSTQDF